MSKTHRFKVLGLLGLPLLGLAIAVMVLSFGHQASTDTEAANTGAKTQMDLLITGVKDNSPQICSSVSQSKCDLDSGSTFTLEIVPSTIPVGGYSAWQTLTNYGSLLYKSTSTASGEITFAPSVFPARNPALPSGKEGTVGHADLTSFSPDPGTGLFPASMQKTTLVTLTFNCATNADDDNKFSDAISLTPFNQNPNGAVFAEVDGVTTHVPNISPMAINCTNPTPTPTPTNTPTITPTPTPCPTEKNKVDDACVQKTKTPAGPPALTVECVLGPPPPDGPGEKATPPATPPKSDHCSYFLNTEPVVQGNATFGRDDDSNGTAGYHGVQIDVTWPDGALDPLKDSSITCAPGALASSKPPVPLVGEWKASCELGTQAKENDIPLCTVTPTPTSPAAPKPTELKPGCDIFDSNAAFTVNLDFLTFSLACNVSGPVKVARLNNPLSTPVVTPVFDKPGETRIMETEMVFMKLQGACEGNNASFPVDVKINPDRRSVGQVWPQMPPPDPFFPANSFFDVFVVVNVPGVGSFHNNDAITIICRVEINGCSVTSLPPILSTYSSLGPPTDLSQTFGTVLAKIQVGDTVISVANASQFTAGDQIFIDDEWMEVKGPGPATPTPTPNPGKLTVTRGIKGTTPAEHQMGADVDKLVGGLKGHTKHTPRKTLKGKTTFDLKFNCNKEGSHQVIVTATFTNEDKELEDAVTDIVTINCVHRPQAVQKLPPLQNLFLTAQGDKLPPDTCLDGTDAVAFRQVLKEEIKGKDKAGDPRALGGFSFEVNYDETKVCVQLVPGELAKAWAAAGGGCIIFDSVTKPTLQGSATITCNSLGKAPLSPPVSDDMLLAVVIVRPMPDEYSLMRPNNGNGNVAQIINKACKLTDRQGDPLAQGPGQATCTDADVTIRYLEGDVHPDCIVDTIDTQVEAFRWGSQKGTLLYSDFNNLEPSKPQQDDDIDVNDLQFVYGRFGSTCANPHPDQDPVNPKAA